MTDAGDHMELVCMSPTQDESTGCDMTMREELTYLKEAYDDCGYEFMRVTKEYEELKISYETLQRQKENEEKRMSKEKKGLEGVIKECKRKYAEKQRINQVLADDLQKSANEKKLVSDNLQKSENEMKRITEELEAKNLSLQEVERKFSGLKETLVKELELTQNERNELLTQNEQLRSRLADLEKQNRRQENSWSEQADVLLNEMKSKVEELAEKHLEIEQLTAKLRETKVENDTLKNKLAGESQKLQERVSVQLKEIKELEAQRNAKDVLLNELNAKIENRNVKINSQQIATLLDEKQKLKSDLNVEISRNRELNGTIRQKDELIRQRDVAIQEKNVFIEQLRSTINANGNELRKLQQKLNAAESEKQNSNSVFQNFNKAKDEPISRLRLEINELSRTVRAKNDEIGKLKFENDADRKRKVLLENGLKALRTEFRAKLVELRALHEELKSEFSAECRERTTSLQLVKNDVGRIFARYVADRDGMQQRLAKMCEEVTCLSETSAQLAKTNDLHLEMMQNELEKKNSACENVERERQKLSTQNENVCCRLEEETNSVNRLDQRVAELTAENVRNANVKLEHSEFAYFREQCVEKQVEVENLMLIIDQLEKANAEMNFQWQERYLEAEERNACLVKALEECRRRDENETEKMDTYE